jgi:hypothetical protein
MEVKDFQSFTKKLKKNNAFAQDNFQLFNMVKENIDDKLESQEKINDLLIEKIYLDNYSFKTYVSEILDKRFPSKWRESRTSREGRAWERLYKSILNEK